MEQLEQALQREQRKLSPDILKSVVIRSVADIQRVVAEFDPAKNKPSVEVPISTMLNETEGGKNITYYVTATTKSRSKRDILIDGLTLIQKRQEAASYLSESVQEVEINGRVVKPVALSSNVNGQSWVDTLIKQWTGGSRDGAIITWDMSDGYQYRYEIFAHRLTRVRRQ